VTEQGEWDNITRILMLIFEKGNPHYFIHPSLFYYISASFLLVAFIVYKLLSAGAAPLGILVRFFLEHEGWFAFYLRLVPALFGALSIVAVYKIARRVWDTKAGLFSALLCCLLPLHIQYSKQIRVDSAFVFFLLFAFYFLYRLYETGELKYYILSGVTVGLAISANYNGAVLFVALAAMHVLSIRNKNKAQGLEFNENVLLIYSMSLSLAVFLLTSPFIVLEADAFKADFFYQSGLSFQAHPGSEGGSFYYYILLNQGFYFALLCVVSMLAFLFWGKSKERIVLAFALGYFIIFQFFVASKFDRFILPVFTFMCIVVGGFCSRSKKWPLIPMAFFILACGQMFLYDYRLSQQRVLEAERPSIVLLTWMEKNILKNSRIFIETEAAPLIPLACDNNRMSRVFREVLDEKYPIINSTFLFANLRNQVNYRADLIGNKEIDYAVIFDRNPQYVKKSTHEENRSIKDFYAALEKRGRVVFEKRFGSRSGFKVFQLY
jgi:4-amino-4-deoxy-L-arabinose transferase-like glycosyltransferase